MAMTDYWRMKDGTSILIKNMDINHLANTINMLYAKRETIQLRNLRNRSVLKTSEEVNPLDLYIFITDPEALPSDSFINLYPSYIKLKKELNKRFLGG